MKSKNFIKISPWCICECIESDMIIKGPIGKIGKFLNKKL
jgi:hypothetical protein